MSGNRACHFVFVSVIFTLSLTICDSAVGSKGLYPDLNVIRAGVCTLEVPTADLLSPQDRASGITIQGNGTRPGYSKIDVCCSGWALKPHTAFVCEPVCEGGCENGNCTAPNVCTCRRGYIKVGPQKCIPTCPIGCLNGVCTVSGVCSCNAGYQLSQDGKLCNPVCTGGCGVGEECIGAEACRCKPGFSLNKTTNKCEYHCEGGCNGGVCIGPNQCSCKPGYKTAPNKTCVPDCPKGCRNGLCTGPNVCTCEQGWVLDKSGSVCEPHCMVPCLNADCTAPNTCTCKQGYIADPRNPQGNRCVASCPGGCDNGTCAAPNFCICNPGFIKQAKGSNVCVRRLKRAAWRHMELIPQQTDK